MNIFNSFQNQHTAELVTCCMVCAGREMQDEWRDSIAWFECLAGWSVGIFWVVKWIMGEYRSINQVKQMPLHCTLLYMKGV